MEYSEAGWQACKDRALAYWKDQNNYVATAKKRRTAPSRGGLITLWKTLVRQHINSALTFIGQ